MKFNINVVAQDGTQLSELVYMFTERGIEVGNITPIPDAEVAEAGKKRKGAYKRTEWSSEEDQMIRDSIERHPKRVDWRTHELQGLMTAMGRTEGSVVARYSKLLSEGNV